MEQTQIKKHYDNIDGLRAIAAIGVVLMHVMANGAFTLADSPVKTVIGSLGVFVQLFFLISGFGLCCGYYERIKNNGISLNTFFNKRYLKIFPYFAFLVLIDVAITLITRGGGYATFYEAFADLTLFFGFLPGSNIQIIGVGWTLGVIFAFYILFPFFVYLLWTRRRAWFALILSLVLNYACSHYFLTDGAAVSCNLARWLCYFIAGGIIYLYREDIARLIGKNIAVRLVSLLVVIALTVGWFFCPSAIGVFDISTLKTMLVFSAWLMYATSVKSVVLANPVSKFISGISFEVYLAHMLVFRAVEMLGLIHIAGTGWGSYLLTSFIVLIGTGVFAWLSKWCLNWLVKRVGKLIGSHRAKQLEKQKINN